MIETMQDMERAGAEASILKDKPLTQPSLAEAAMTASAVDSVAVEAAAPSAE